ncbi:MAG: FAD-binding oxidoreductase [Gemmatimonadales bacterium]|jgi:sarcosine oxidase subunit beta|nr:FAD-binding oxidoreductase [Gemmatimonadales bacterium]MBT3498993.1 FAD-binding oxidoreductase [Gemmatimonadales bacterium]MBT3774396.1 FAD-binding oxidoreductase [Gemmatimonadales bacterium]MBT3957768.1 FAD-binding oxidoreductase [Gemmatimonadales bacterium]MBT4187472.1 FAD-binding oxidoreductase [Gemmatimonadales bacterium]
MNLPRPSVRRISPNTSDVIVVGAGIIGLAAAHALLEAGSSVRIVEQFEPGTGQSTRTGGGIRVAHGSEINVQMAQLSLPTWLNFEQKFGIDPRYQQTGHLFLTSKDTNGLTTQSDLLNSLGVHCDVLSREELCVLWPSLGVTGFQAGNYCKTGGYLDHHRVVEGFAQKVQAGGAHLEFNTRVEGILRDDDRVIGVRTSEGLFTGETVVNAAGPHAGVISSLAGLEVPFVSRRHELLILEQTAQVPESIPWLIDIDQQVHMRPDGSGRALVGGFLGHDDPSNPDSYDQAVSKRWSTAVREQASRSFRLTGPNSAVLSGWAGLYPGTVDYLPVLERSIPGLVTAAGFSGTGLMHAPVVGQIVADLVRGGTTSVLDISSLQSSRFAEEKKTLDFTGF